MVSLTIPHSCWLICLLNVAQDTHTTTTHTFAAPCIKLLHKMNESKFRKSLEFGRCLRTTLHPFEEQTDENKRLIGSFVFLSTTVDQSTPTNPNQPRYFPSIHSSKFSYFRFLKETYMCFH